VEINMDSMTKTGDLQIAESKIAKAADGTVLDISSEVIVWTPQSGISEYQGTRAALESEGVIPSGTEWPADGFDEVWWRDDMFEYALRRNRPDGVSGPRKMFSRVDWWSIRVTPINRKNPRQEAIERKKKALEDEIFSQSAEGVRVIQKRYDDFCRAKNDADFQKFRQLLGIDKRTPRRGRR